MTLEEYIQFCLAEMERRQAEEEARRDAEEAAFQALLQSVKQNLRGRIIQAIPQPLRPHADYAGGRPLLEQLQRYPETWTPSEFKVEVPGLRRIDFFTASDGPTSPLRLTDIKVDNVSFRMDWTAAVAAAATP